ncbi:MAG: hypothetical protein ACFN1I_09610 [Selenomonas artemidis]
MHITQLRRTARRSIMRRAVPRRGNIAWAHIYLMRAAPAGSAKRRENASPFAA